MFKLLEDLKRAHKVKMLPGMAPHRIYRAIYYPTHLKAGILQVEETTNGHTITVWTTLADPYLPDNAGRHAQFKIHETWDIKAETLADHPLPPDQIVTQIRSSGTEYPNQLILYGGICGPMFRNKFYCHGSPGWTDAGGFFSNMAQIAAQTAETPYIKRYLEALVKTVGL